MARKKTSLLEDIILIVSKLPWWVGLALALISYLILHAMASRPIMPATVTPGQMGAAVNFGLVKVFALFGQYILPFAFGMGAILSAIAAARQKKLYNNIAARKDVSALNDMGWEDFERLVSEYYRRKGFQVTREGGNGPDGGIDLVLRQKSETYLVQCKQWRAYKVGVQPVRELYGVMASRSAAGGYVVTSGEYTAEAKKFVQGLNITLIDGLKLREMIDSASKVTSVQEPVWQIDQKTASPAVRPTPSSALAPPDCPKCGAEMKKRVARQGENAGKEFWGCATYPKCSGTRPMEIQSSNESASPSAVLTQAPDKRTCPNCGGELVLREFQSGVKSGQKFYGCTPCKKGWPVEQPV